MSVARFVDFKRTGRAGISRPVGMTFNTHKLELFFCYFWVTVKKHCCHFCLAEGSLKSPLEMKLAWQLCLSPYLSSYLTTKGLLTYDLVCQIRDLCLASVLLRSADAPEMYQQVC